MQYDLSVIPIMDRETAHYRTCPVQTSFHGMEKAFGMEGIVECNRFFSMLISNDDYEVYVQNVCFYIMVVLNIC